METTVPSGKHRPLPTKFRIGIEEMDTQHAYWIHLIEEFRAVGSEHLLDHAGISAARHALEELLRYTKSHFSSEEQFLAKHQYPNLEQHKKQHRELEATVQKLLDELNGHTAHHSTPLKLNLFATIWLMDHIAKDDVDYAQFILGKLKTIQ